ncbi:MAG: class I SAM-dependent methyltransferase [Sporomusaceae bacterium]|nr:class I SAM-dependent methyltransferase [Sporomusaceae bacterium]
MKYWTLGRRLPRKLFTLLFGDREHYGLDIKSDDEDWIKWQDFYVTFYKATQKQGIGNLVNEAGYTILDKVSFTGKSILEIGPGLMPHTKFWRSLPQEYVIVDINEDLLEGSKEILLQKNVNVRPLRISSSDLPVATDSIDIILSFFNLEHLRPLDQYLNELHRILKPGGLFVGAIPCEGGIAWGVGRFLTARRFAHKNSSINYDKIICWEHPNFANEILIACDSIFTPLEKDFWPFGQSIIDINLVARFIYQKGQ